MDKKNLMPVYYQIGVDCIGFEPRIVTHWIPYRHPKQYSALNIARIQKAFQGAALSIREFGEALRSLPKVSE